jgi:hypothetical protein
VQLPRVGTAEDRVVLDGVRLAARMRYGVSHLKARGVGEAEDDAWVAGLLREDLYLDAQVGQLDLRHQQQPLEPERGTACYLHHLGGGGVLGQLAYGVERVRSDDRLIRDTGHDQQQTRDDCQCPDHTQGLPHRLSHFPPPCLLSVGRYHHWCHMGATH